MATKQKAEEKLPEQEKQPQAVPLFYTVAINPVTGQYARQTNASPGGLRVLGNVLLREYERINQEIINTLGQKEGAKEE